MTDPGGPSQQRPTSSAPPRAPQGWSGGVRREGRDAPDPDDEAVLAPREAALIEESVVTVGRRGRGPIAVTGLIAAAFLLGRSGRRDGCRSARRADATPLADAPAHVRLPVAVAVVHDPGLGRQDGPGLDGRGRRRGERPG
jgi:hypothetical protein